MRPSVVYRRRGWSYGLLRLTLTERVDEPVTGSIPISR
jgi:hypothetical protein